MSCVLYNQEPMALISYMETYFKHRPPDISLFSEDNFEVLIHKELFYQTQLMCLMIESTDSDYCCSNFTVICPMPKEDLELIVQFLYSGQLFSKSQKTATRVSKYLEEIFGFPPLHLNSSHGSKFEFTSNSIAEYPNSHLEESYDRKKLQSLASTSMQQEFSEELVTIKTESEDIFNETNLDEKNIHDPLATSFTQNGYRHIAPKKEVPEFNCAMCSSVFPHYDTLIRHIESVHEGKRAFQCVRCNLIFTDIETLNIHIETYCKGKNRNDEPKYHGSNLDKIICTICNMVSVSKRALGNHVARNHKNACIICFKPFDSKQHLEIHISNTHSLSDFRNFRRCVICDIAFTREDNHKLREHMESEHNIGYVCSICQMKFPSRVTLIQHKTQEHKMRKSNIKEDNLCNVCLKPFESKQELESHISNTHSLSDFRNFRRCVICDIAYTGEDSHKLEEHLKSEHHIAYACSICQMKFPSRLTLQQHKNQEHTSMKSKIKEYNLCSLCGKEFTNRRTYFEHISKSCKDWRGNKCLICNELFVSRALTMEHINANHPEINLYNCSECGSRFMSEKGLKDHISFAHGNNAENICPLCGKIMASKAVLRKHMAFVHDRKNNPRKFKCTLCEKSFSVKNALENHILSVHEGSKFQCPNCTEVFNSKKGLTLHIGQTHERSKLFQCSLCDSAFVQEKNFLKHVAFVHEKTIGNLCPHCGKNCMNPGEVQKHIAKVHVVGRPHKCEDCEKDYKTVFALKSHIKISHEGKRVECPVCQKPFTSNRTVKIHIEAVHEKKKPHVCDICNERFTQKGNLVIHKKGKHKLTL